MSDQNRSRTEVQAEINGLFRGRNKEADAAMRRAYELGIEAHTMAASENDEGGGPIELPPPPGQTSGPG
jgi:hypothetical protein